MRAVLQLGLTLCGLVLVFPGKGIGSPPDRCPRMALRASEIARVREALELLRSELKIPIKTGSQVHRVEHGDLSVLGSGFESVVFLFRQVPKGSGTVYKRYHGQGIPGAAKTPLMFKNGLLAFSLLTDLNPSTFKIPKIRSVHEAQQTLELDWAPGSILSELLDSDTLKAPTKKTLRTYWNLSVDQVP